MLNRYLRCTCYPCRFMEFGTQPYPEQLIFNLINIAEQLWVKGLAQWSSGGSLGVRGFKNHNLLISNPIVWPVSYHFPLCWSFLKGLCLCNLICKHRFFLFTDRYVTHYVTNGLYLHQILTRWWSTWRQRSLFWTVLHSSLCNSSSNGWETLCSICCPTCPTRSVQDESITERSSIH